MAAGDSAVVSTVGVVAVFVVAVGVVGAVAVTAVVAPVLTVSSSPQPRTSRMIRIETTTAPRALPMMMFRFFAVRAIFLPLGLDRLNNFSIVPCPLRPLTLIRRRNTSSITLTKRLIFLFSKKSCTYSVNIGDSTKLEA